MKVKINGMMFDSSKEIILIELSDKDKTNIKNMKDNIYCVAPAVYTKEEVKKFMDNDIEYHVPKISTYDIKKRKELISILKSIMMTFNILLRNIELDHKMKVQMEKQIKKLKNFIYK